ncbi:MipA/OmpV family protein [Rheinheimera sp. UJ51]|uniref:MipA/OmpV family protein n=1 Tax=Rheinheimera sp. UJ51 TaxID=2892446 RepID=UPI001E2F3FD3|nr:MipA/OmpV family protein [Rheinheimera sp. UJ51]MCC5452262.1 MipA/OmpV family protein [Rheinheimera sp. UJ51]
MLTKVATANDVPVGEWQVAVALGYGYVENPRAHAEPIKTYVLPSVLYYGERFYLENFTLGYSLFENEQLFVDIQSRLNEDGLFFELDGIGNLLVTDLFGITNGKTPGRPSRPINYAAIERKVSYLLGSQLTWQSAVGDMTAGAYTDISGVHNGYELHLRYKYVFDWYDVSWGLELGLTQKSRELVSYYYYLTDAELQTARTSYQPRDTLNSHIRWVANKTLNAHWTLISLLEYNHLGHGISQSPLIEKSDYLSAFVGVSYSF